MKISTIAASLLGGVSALACMSGAEAQTASSDQEVVVTGSRVIRNGNNSPTPVTVVQTQELMALQPTTINDALNNLPVFQGSRGQFSQPNTTGLFGGGNPATTQLNLRNLGPQRTLILFDGQRVAPTNALGVVDVDMVPQQLIQRVDIVTGGVSAVYGSDAIAGVVNYVVDRNFNGFKAEGNFGISARGDDQSWKAGFAAGTKLGDKGHIEASYDHFDNQGLARRNMRDFWRYNLVGGSAGSTAAVGTNANPYVLIYDSHNAQNTPGGFITTAASNAAAVRGLQFSSNGVATPFVHGQLTGTANTEIGGDGSVGGLNSFKAPVKFDQAFVRFDYALTEGLNFHAQGAGNWKADTTFSNPTSFNNQIFSTSNAFLPAALRTAMGAATTFTMSKQYAQVPLLSQTSDVKNVFFNAGLDGDIGKWSWAGDFNYSNNEINDEFQNNINNRKMAAALDAVTNAAGQVVCNASLTNPAEFGNCVAFNPFGPTSASDAAIDYITDTTHLIPKFVQYEASAHIGGELFNLPAGPVVAAASGEYRKQTFSQGADALPTDPNTCTGGIRFNCGATNVAYNVAFAVGRPSSQTVKEGALEIDVPLLKDVPLFQSLNFNGAVRYTSYDVGGKAWTWKAGLDWHVNDDLRIRATQSRDIEAPTLGMVFQPLLVAFVGNQDTLTGQSPQVPASNTGSPDLVSEIGHTTTAGLIWRPSALPGFSVSLDGYHIKVDGALIQIQGQSAVTQAVCYASGGTSPYCALQIRPVTVAQAIANPIPANTVTGWIDIFQNVSKIETYGADLEINYVTRIADHQTSLRLLTTWQPHYLFDQPGAPEYDFGNVTFPNLVPLQNVPAVQLTGVLNVAVTDKLSVGVTERWRSKMDLEPRGITCGTGALLQECVFPVGAAAYATTSLNVNYQIDKNGNAVYVNVRNVFDNLATPTVGLSGSNGYAQSDDPVGRAFTVGFRARF